MTLWVDKGYWKEADGLAHCVHRQLLSQISQRATYFYEAPYIENLKYTEKIIKASGVVDFILTVTSDASIKEPDNLGYCLTSDEHCEIEIITYLPKYYHVSRLLKSKQYNLDLLNVVRHEIEHMLQSGAYEVKAAEMIKYDRSERNYMLDSAEVPAYVHGFRIAAKDDLSFCKEASKFIGLHGQSLRLEEEEITYTKKVWLNYLKNLKN